MPPRPPLQGRKGEERFSYVATSSLPYAHQWTSCNPAPKLVSQGTQIDTQEALMWLKKAATAGHDIAEAELAAHYYKMRLFNKVWPTGKARRAMCVAPSPLVSLSLSFALHCLSVHCFKAVQWATVVCKPIEDATDASIRQLPDDLRTARASACWHLARCYERGVGVEEKSAALTEK